MEEMRKLPKNIRQIGEREEKIKVYMEDYVSTYIHKLKLFDDGRPRVGILLGETGTIEGAPHMFIWGAVEAPGIFEAGEAPSFHELVWNGLYEKKDVYFPAEAVCGWFFCIRGEDNLKVELLQHAHRETFMQDQLLFVWQEGENDRFYSMESGGLKALKGYSIYYERNDSMQEYLISTNQKKRPGSAGTMPLPVSPSEKEGPEPVIQNFRSIMQKKQSKKKKFRYTYAASLAAVALGVMVLYRIRELPALPAHTFPTGQASLTEEINETETGWITEESGIVEEIPGNVFPTAPPPTEAPTEAPTTAAPVTEPPVEVPTEAEPVFYTVKAGDTLGAISEKVYKSSKMVDKICEANGITNPDYLYPGQQLIMP